MTVVLSCIASQSIGNEIERTMVEDVRMIFYDWNRGTMPRIH